MILSCASDPYDMGRIGFQCPPLPLEPSALEPIFSRESVLAHYGQQQNYFRKAAQLAEDLNPALLDLPLVEVVRRTAFRETTGFHESGLDLYQQASQAWNHAFLWLSLRPTARLSRWEAMPHEHRLETALGDAADRSGIDGFRELQERILGPASRSFGSQWAWLVYDGADVRVMLTDEAESPITQAGVMPLLVVDLWEHAFFLNYRFGRAKYARDVVERVLNWDRADALMTLEFCDR